MSRSTPNDTKALARFVLAPTKTTHGRSLDQQWGDLASFLRGPASALARWLAVAQMHSVYRQMRAKKSLDERRDQNLLVSAPSMGIDMEVRVLPEVGHDDRSEPQGRNREGPSGGSGERNRGPTNRNRIRGGAEQGERPGTREALVTEARRRISGGRVVKVDAPTWGDLA
jgi:hypothetical protein